MTNWKITVWYVSFVRKLVFSVFEVSAVQSSKAGSYVFRLHAVQAVGNLPLVLVCMRFELSAVCMYSSATASVFLCYFHSKVVGNDFAPFASLASFFS